MMFACQKDPDIESALAISETLKLRLEVPELQVVDITRGAVEETEAYNVKVYIFNEAGNREGNPVNITLTPTNEDSYSRKYEVDTKITLPAEGEYDIYAIANTESNSLWTGVADFDAATTKTAFEAIALTLNTIENPSSRMTLSGQATFAATGAVDLAVDIKMTRPYAKVTFNVKNGTVNPNFKFTPTSYNIYNVPTESKMFDNSNVTLKYRNYENRAIPLSGSFEFLQMENAFEIVEGPAKYTDREKRVSDTDRTFAYAPANSTYVVISGDGTETDEEGNIVKISKTNYTIHLGDFSATGDYGDFSVERNTHYTYNVTVNGVNMVEVEAKRGEGDYENGAEGTIIDMSKSKQVYNLDAHYETVLLKLDITNTTFKGSEGLTLSVSTPMMADADKNVTVGWDEISAALASDATLEAFYDKYDAQWVEFLPIKDEITNSASDFKAYPKDKTGLLDVCNLMKAIYDYKTTGATTIFNIVSEITTPGTTPNEYVYVMAYINEYYYDGESWAKFVNKPDREMKILQSPEVSTDGQSIYSQALCAFKQKSISTMFDPSSTENVFGIEMYDETGVMDISTGLSGSSRTNGWANMTSYITIGTTWNTILNNGGYDYNGQPNGNSYNALKNTNNAAYACMQRNRDLDGDGAIDADEIRWYMPALDQYSAFWYGEEALPTYARLFQGLTTDIKNGTAYNQQHHYYTSTGDSYRIFWAIEGSSFGHDNVSWQANTHNTRCIRNLKSVSEEPAMAISNPTDSYYITVNNFVETAYRATTQNGQYPEHHERDVANKLPHAFKVAANNLSARTPGATYTLNAPNVSSAVSNPDRTTTITFASLESGTVGYYYTTNATAARTNPLEIVNNQVTIDYELTDGGETTTEYAPDLASVDYDGSTITLNFANVESGVRYYYTRANTANAAQTVLTITNNTATISYGYDRTARNFYIWADNSSVYTRVTATRSGNFIFGYDYSATFEEQDPKTSGGQPTSIYLWIYDQGLGIYSNATIVTVDGVQIGDPKTHTSSASTRYSRLAATTQDLCANYSETADPVGAPKWRVPNQREMTAMSQYASNLDLTGSYYTSTKFSNAINASSTGTNRYSYLYSGSQMTLEGDDSGYSIRCVRDLAEGEGPSGSTDGDFEEGGGI